MIYEDERETVVTYVSTCGLQRQSNKDIWRPDEALRSPTLHIEHIEFIILTRTFLVNVEATYRRHFDR
jgi:hypothetical protein